MKTLKSLHPNVGPRVGPTIYLNLPYSKLEHRREREVVWVNPSEKEEREERIIAERRDQERKMVELYAMLVI